MIAFTHLQRFAEPPGPFLRHQPRSPAAGGKRDSAQPWTTSTVGMIDAGEGTSDSHPRHHCTGPFAHGDIAHRAQLSRGLGSQRVGVSSPIPSTTRVRIPLEQHRTWQSAARREIDADFQPLLVRLERRRLDQPRRHQAQRHLEEIGVFHARRFRQDRHCASSRAERNRRVFDAAPAFDLGRALYGPSRSKGGSGGVGNSGQMRQVRGAVHVK